MKEIARQVFVSLNKENNMYYVLNDQNYVFKFYEENENLAHTIFNAWLKGGYRERYAVENGIVNTKPNGYIHCIQFNLPTEPGSDSNGALYDLVRKEWVN